MATPGAFPAAAVAWLAPERPGNVLAIGTASAPTAAHLQRLGNRVTFATRAPADVHRACTRHPSFRGVAAAPDALPFVPCTFDAVLVSQGMHQLPPGLVLAEFARVLAPGGRLAVVATFRDDSVPWVRRLAAIVQRYDPKAMRAADEAAATIPASAHFPQVEQRDFRRWVPITREGMVTMVTSNPRLSALAEADAIVAIASPFAGFATSNVVPSEDGRHSPPMNRFVGTPAGRLIAATLSLAINPTASPCGRSVGRPCDRPTPRLRPH